MNLILFTSSYPYVRGGEQNFLSNEVQQLLAEVEKVVIVHENVDGPCFGNLMHAEIDISYAEYFAAYNNFTLLLKGFFSPLFYRGLMEDKFPSFSLKALRRLIAFAGKANITNQWVVNWLRQHNLDGRDCLFYTYWFDQAAGGITLAKRQYSELKFVSSVHGYDVFDDQYYNTTFWPCRKTVLNSVDRVFSASPAGRSYFVNHYPEFAALFETSLLGVPEPGFLNQSSKDGIFRIVSCSIIRPEKRVDRILSGVLHAAKLRPKQRFEWTHIGNGLTQYELQKLADEKFPANAKAYFPGYSDNEALMHLYGDKPFDVFINVSETEGTPVSIMEAISCGIPVIASAVGGNVEIVSEQNGIHLSQDPTLDEIAAALFYLIDHPEETEKKRRESRHIWQTRYNAQFNFSEFAKRLKNIRLGL